MGKEFFDHDQFSGITEFIETDGDIARVTSSQDVQPVIERAKAYANEGLTDKGIKDSMWHYCDVPLTILVELKKKGINMFHPGPGDWQKFFDTIESDYPLLKLTAKKHRIAKQRVKKEIILP